MFCYVYHITLGYEPPAYSVPDLWYNGMFSCVGPVFINGPGYELLGRTDNGRILSPKSSDCLDKELFEREVSDGDLVVEISGELEKGIVLPVECDEWFFVYYDADVYLEHCEGGRSFLRIPHVHRKGKPLVRFQDY